MILFVGDEPSKRSDPNVAFKGAACEKRLMEWISILVKPLANYRLINRVDPEFDMIVFGHHYSGRGPIVALGNKAAKALKYFPHFKLPHPSGRNRLLNDKQYLARKLAECKTFVRDSTCLK